MPQGDFPIPGADPNLDRLSLLADVCHYLPYQHGDDGKFLSCTSTNRQLTDVDNRPFVPFDRDLFRTLSGLGQQPLEAGMDWTNDLLVSNKRRDDHQGQYHEESPLPGKPKGIQKSPEENAKEADPTIDLASLLQTPSLNPALIKLAETFAKVGGMGLIQVHDIVKHHLEHEGHNVPGTFVSTDQVASQGM